MIRLQRYRSALKSVTPIVFHTFFSQEPPFCASDEIIEELEMGHYLTDSELASLKREYFEAAREQTMYNLNDPNGSRAAMEADIPMMLRSIGFAAGFKNKYQNLEAYESSKSTEVKDGNK